MNERAEKKKGGSRRKGAILLFIVCGILFVAAAAGYILRNTAVVKTNLDQMRMSAVLHAASEGYRSDPQVCPGDDQGTGHPLYFLPAGSRNPLRR